MPFKVKEDDFAPFVSEFFKDSGANIVQEIAFTLSAGIDYVNKFGSSLFNKISFELIQGNNYFFEIAKIQALRILWSIISKKYGNQIDDCIITAKPSLKNKKLINLYFSGQLTVPGPGVPPSIISGKVVANEILKKV